MMGHESNPSGTGPPTEIFVGGVRSAAQGAIDAGQHALGAGRRDAMAKLSGAFLRGAGCRSCS
jgi:hypothetical protein